MGFGLGAFGAMCLGPGPIGGFPIEVVVISTLLTVSVLEGGKGRGT